MKGRSNVEHLDVLVMGAGLSGIAAGHYIQSDCPWASYAIFESRDVIGGTWDLFRYPGVRSDSDMYTLGYSFRPWDNPYAIAEGEWIRQYLVDTAKEEGIDAHIRFGHKVLSAAWSSDDACWHVKALRTDSGEEFELTCGFLFSCAGYYRYDQGYQPEFPGLDTFEGTFVHPQAWPSALDTGNKTVVVIGSGATAVTLVPSLAKTADRVVMLQRSPTYIASVPQKNPLAGTLKRILPGRLSGSLLRWGMALGTQGFYKLSRTQPALVKKILRKGLERELPKGYDIDTHFTPSYNPWDERFCVVPDSDLFKAIRSGKAEVVTDRIESFTPTGIDLVSGRHLDADIIVSATGLDLLFAGGIDLSVDGEPVDVAASLSYKGMMLSDVPNFAAAIGYTNASWTLKAELTCEYVMKLLNRLHETGLRQCTPRNTDPTVKEQQLLSLTSGYVMRAIDRFPKQGNKFPWQVHQSYLRDYLVMKRKPIDDGVMSFTNRAPATSSR